MSGIREFESIPDPRRMIEGLRDTGYRFVTAVADLVDNSIAAEATMVDIQMMMDHEGDIRLFIADNGTGMDEQDLIDAMRYGSPARPDPASLGKFGLGLKAASTAFCRRLSVISRPSSDANSLMAIWDLDHVVSKGEWSLQMSNEPDDEAVEQLDNVSGEGSGTVVLWTKVDRLLKNYQDPRGRPARNALDRHCRDLTDHIAMTYQRFLDEQDNRARNVEIRINGTSVQPWDPFQKGISELIVEQTVSVEDTDAEFHVKAYILPRREQISDSALAKAAKLSSDRQGMYIYRENRLIHDADWLGMFQKEPHGTLLRVEFSFDHKLDTALHLDIKKSQIILDDDLWKWLKNQFLGAPRREANQRYRKGRRNKIRNDSTSTHDPSNVTIGNKDPEIDGAEVNVRNLSTGEVSITNKSGTHRSRLKITSPSKPGEDYVQPVNGIDDGLLFEPALINGNRGVRINVQHPYYHKVYVPNRDESVTVQGLDSLLWALCVAEWNVTSKKTEDAFESMRYEVSRILRTLVKDLPEADVEEEEDAA